MTGPLFGGRGVVQSHSCFHTSFLINPLTGFRFTTKKKVGDESGGKNSRRSSLLDKITFPSWQAALGKGNRGGKPKRVGRGEESDERTSRKLFFF